MPNKKIMAIFSLVVECEEKGNRELEKEISNELSNLLIPWVKSVNLVKVIER